MWSVILQEGRLATVPGEPAVLGSDDRLRLQGLLTVTRAVLPGDRPTGETCRAWGGQSATTGEKVHGAVTVCQSAGEEQNLVLTVGQQARNKTMH